MSNYGIQAENSSGELTLSDNGTTYGYIGRATYQSTTPPGTSTINSIYGYTVYTISWPGDIIVALPIKTNGPTFQVSQTQSSGVWTIRVFKSNGSLNSVSLDNQEATEVYVFGAPVAVSGYGVALYDDSGNVVADLAMRPLTYKAFVVMDTGTNTVSIPSMASPAVIGLPMGKQTQSTQVGGTGKFTNRIYGQAWIWSSDNLSITRKFVEINYSTDDGSIAVATNNFTSTCIIIDVAGLN